MEQWRQLKDCPGYLVNKDGRVWSEKLNKMLATKYQHGTTVCQFGPKYGKRRQVSIETMVMAYKLGSVDAAIAATKQANKQKATAASRPYCDAKFAATHAKIMPLWNAGYNAKQIREELGVGENTVLRHLKAEGLSAQRRIREQQAALKAEREAVAKPAKAFRDVRGEQLSLFAGYCAICGKPLMKAGTKYCSRECALEAGRRKYAEKYGYDRNAIVCQDCGCTFSTDRHRGPKPKRCPTCEEKHKREVKRINRRYGNTLNARGRYWTRITGAAYEPINPDVVFERDDWTCYLCGCELSERDGDVRDNYPTVDHVIPLSHGGAHTYDNVRACCHTCNSYKGATMPEEVTCCA